MTLKKNIVTFVLMCYIMWLPPRRFWTTEDGAHYPDHSAASAYILRAGVCEPSRKLRKAGCRPQGDCAKTLPVVFTTLMDDNNFLFFLADNKFSLFSVGA